MLGRFFLIGLLLVGIAATALYATKTGYHVWDFEEGGERRCFYWIGLGVIERPVALDAECPLLLRDVVL